MGTTTSWMRTDPRFLPFVSMESPEKSVAARAPKGMAELNLKAAHAG